MGDHEDDERRERPKRGVERSAGAGQVARSLAKLDLSSMTGHSEVLRAANAFSRQVSPFTGLLQDAERARKLTAGLSVLDADRRDVLGTAIVASDVTKHLGLDRKPFLDHVTRSISTVVAGQLSLTAKQAMLGIDYKPPAFQAALGLRSQEVATRLAETLHASLSQQVGQLGLAGQVAEMIKVRTELFAGGAWAFVERLEELDEQALLFVERHGWPLPLALPVKAVHRLARMAGRGKREVTAHMVRSFEPRSKAFRLSRDRLLDSEHFASRRQPVMQGLAALNRGHYYAAICVLLPLVEGVLVDAVLADDPPRNRAPHKALEEIKASEEEVDALTVGTIETLLISAASGSALFGGFDRRDYGVPGESRRLNRHAILHGAARRYGTHANALKLFLLLVALAETLGLYEEEKKRAGEFPAAA